MRTYMVITHYDRFYSGWLPCLRWAENRVLNDNCPIARVFKLRAGEKDMRIVAEVTSEGIRVIKHGRIQKMTKEDRYGIKDL